MGSVYSVIFNKSKFYLEMEQITPSTPLSPAKVSLPHNMSVYYQTVTEEAPRRKSVQFMFPLVHKWK